MKIYFVVAVAFILIQNFTGVFSSEGDRSPFYRNCVKKCLTANCTKEDETSFQASAAEAQDFWSKLLRWNCKDECRYQCMWRTVSLFEESGSEVPKFHGKWPFKRYFGVQEPAAAFSSLLNLAAHIYMLCAISETKGLTPRYTPLLLFWYIFIAVCVNAWTWSAIFHTRDTPFTEFMDYACALTMVTALFIASIVRVLHKHNVIAAIAVSVPLLYCVEHIMYLYKGKIDYQYNMAVNLSFGLLASSLWLSWAALHWYRRGPVARYVWRVVLFNKLSGAALLLELFDFAPVLRAWDAHALWHLATAPLPLLFYRFVIDDLTYLQSSVVIPKVDLKMA